VAKHTSLLWHIGISVPPLTSTTSTTTTNCDIMKNNINQKNKKNRDFKSTKTIYTPHFIKAKKIHIPSSQSTTDHAKYPTYGKINTYPSQTNP